ncbi:hypothetical protein AVEN_170730-1 [Araneus ventricosus]|uniref:Uncharacterized protein n=1 Tax=Araneus ventricosus TaxID=182803 RepID=A0A4Y2Q9X2_ARAVE|nr:hypothetical protein AVEN_229906-1 [Araneus ventricosus]GBN60264.1 hypothetical protein AVEN_170730-1 [Araneus ventricosus]
MHDHGVFCGHTKPISISKVLSILKITEYWQEVPNGTVASSFSEGHNVVRSTVYDSIYRWPFSSWEIVPSGPVTCTINGTRYESLAQPAHSSTAITRLCG